MRSSVGLIGFGTVGQSVARLLSRDPWHRIRLARVCTRPGGRARPAWLPSSVDWTDRFDRLLDSDIDVVVELVGGAAPARDWIERALLAGKSVVTANKQLVAECGPDLLALAARQRQEFRFEGAVAGGIPIIRAVQDGLAGDRLVRIAGVLNGTCNYVLTRMESDGLSFADALSEAQARGYAEADPTADIEGFDARAKLVILCAVGLGMRVNPHDIPCASIAGISRNDLARARTLGCAIRQVSCAERAGATGLRASVGPALVPSCSHFARAQGCENVIVVTGETGGETAYSGQGAGGGPTAVAVVSDLLAIAADRSPRALPLEPCSAVDVDSLPASVVAWPSVHSFARKGLHHHA
jgi:homoserine dehydrogenase